MKLEEFDRTKEAVFNPVDIVQKLDGTAGGLARFRNRSVSQFFYSADNLDNDVWEMRSLANESQRDVKQTILDLAVALGKEL